MTHSYTILGIGLSENRLGHLNTLTVSYSGAIDFEWQKQQLQKEH